jgi:hemerythrin-like domain-containing protein
LKATEQLRKEHKAVKVMLRVLEKITKNLEAGDSIDPDHLASIIEFFQVFVDRCHHVKEENMLFVAMQKTTDPGDGDRIGALLKDHVSGRNYIRDLSHAAKHFQDGDMAAVPEIIRWARAYITLVIQHIDIEDNVLYPLANERLSPKKQEELLAQFDKLEEEIIGVGKHEEFHKLIDKLKGIYLS